MMCKRFTKLLAVSLVLGLMLGRANADLVGYWNFDEGTGAVAADKSFRILGDGDGYILLTDTRIL